MPVGLKGAPECSRAACYKKIYRCAEDGRPLCVTHYREKFDEPERGANAREDQAGGCDE